MFHSGSICVTIYCAGSVPPPDSDCLCDPEVVAVDLSDQDILITLATNLKGVTENCPLHLTMTDTCFPNTCSFSDKPCDFSTNADKLLTVSLKDQYQYEHNTVSSFLPSALTLAIDTTPSDGRCLREIEMGILCKTGMKE